MRSLTTLSWLSSVGKPRSEAMFSMTLTKASVHAAHGDKESWNTEQVQMMMFHHLLTHTAIYCSHLVLNMNMKA